MSLLLQVEETQNHLVPSSYLKALDERAPLWWANIRCTNRRRSETDHFMCPGKSNKWRSKSSDEQDDLCGLNCHWESWGSPVESYFIGPCLGLWPYHSWVCVDVHISCYHQRPHRLLSLHCQLRPFVFVLGACCWQGLTDLCDLSCDPGP